MTRTTKCFADDAEFRTIMAHVNRILLPERRLPSMVFRDCCTNFLASSNDFVIGANFWRWLARSELVIKDDQVMVAMIDPNPNAFRRNIYAALAMPATASPEEYWDCISRSFTDSEADAIAYISSVIAIVPTSLSWGIWSERDINLSIIGLCGDAPRRDLGREWRSIEDVVQNELTLEFRDGVVPSDLSANLSGNYGHGTTGQS